MDNSIWPVDRTPTGTTTLGQIESESNGKEGSTPHSPNFRTIRDSLVSYPEHKNDSFIYIYILFTLKRCCKFICKIQHKTLTTFIIHFMLDIKCLYSFIIGVFPFMFFNLVAPLIHIEFRNLAFIRQLFPTQYLRPIWKCQHRWHFVLERKKIYTKHYKCKHDPIQNNSQKWFWLLKQNIQNKKPLKQLCKNRCTFNAIPNL